MIVYECPECGRTMKVKGPLGTRKSGWKLTAAAKRDIVRGYRAGEYVRVLAKRHDISVQAISALCLARGLRRKKRRSDAHD